MLGEPARTQFDLNFPLLGIPVRVSPWFWLTAVLLGWGATGGDPKLLMLWIAAVFLSILVHEFGHALAFRRFGVRSHVVLYHFGGIAVPDEVYSAYQYGGGFDSKSRILVSAAGPGVQLVFAGIIILLVLVAGHDLPFYFGPLERFLPTRRGAPIPNDILRAMAAFLLYVNIFWALLNLLPIYPLDGGQIARELFLWFSPGRAIKQSLILSIVTGAVVAVWALSQRSTLLALMFGVLAYSSYQTLQAYSGRGGFGGRRRW